MKTLSALFHEINPKIGFSSHFSEFHPYPFSHYEKLEAEIGSFNKLDFLNQTSKLFKKIKDNEAQALLQFEFESNLCPKNSKAKYVNAVLKKLGVAFRRINNKNISRNKKVDEYRYQVFQQKNYFPLYQFLLDSVLVCLAQILRTHQDIVETELKTEIENLLKPKEPILSFQIVKNIPDLQLKDSFENRLISKGLIHPKTEFTTIKNLFHKQPLEEKIEWTSTLGALYYFITLLIKEDKYGRRAVEDPKNKHWQITSEFFTYNNGKLVPNLKGQKEPRASLKTPIELFIDDLKSLT